ncbi:hypothetical protein [Solibacillus ferritrahens]|uniref:Uncharacterized protein n=2 Tax=Solibacillus merdavium TaxID=2762218 RepID=A0ABR8XPQ2_9BACL|nr:hypothetical protein [Solibacillus merdavium]
MMKIKNKIPDYIVCIFLGVSLGAISKYLDTIAIVDGSWWLGVLSYFGDLFTRLGIWVLIATFIAAYSRTFIRSAINTFLFFMGMLVSYYIYSAYLFGFFPTSYFILWGTVALASPVLGIIVWGAKNKKPLYFGLPALPMGLMLSLSLGMGLFYISLNYIEELIMYIILCIIFYKDPKQMVITIVLSFVIGFITEQIIPFHF